MVYGVIKVYVDLGVVKQILLNEGFYEPLLQEWRGGQVFGLVKPLNELVEVHVRGYEDCTLDARWSSHVSTLSTYGMDLSPTMDT